MTWQQTRKCRDALAETKIDGALAAQIPGVTGTGYVEALIKTIGELIDYVNDLDDRLANAESRISDLESKTAEHDR